MSITATRTVPVDGIGPVEVTRDHHHAEDSGHPHHAHLPPDRDRRAHHPDRPVVQHQAGYYQGEPIAIGIADLPRLDAVLISH